MEARRPLYTFDLTVVPVRVKAKELKSLTEVQRPGDKVRIDYVFHVKPLQREVQSLQQSFAKSEGFFPIRQRAAEHWSAQGWRGFLSLPASTTSSIDKPRLVWTPVHTGLPERAPSATSHILVIPLCSARTRCSRISLVHHWSGADLKAPCAGQRLSTAARTRLLLIRPSLMRFPTFRTRAIFYGNQRN